MIAAVLKDDLEMVKYLIANGSDVNADESESSLLTDASVFGYKIKDDHTDVAEFHNNPIIYASSLPIVKYLLESKANVNYKSSWGGNALWSAAKDNRLDLIDVLAQNGADVNDWKHDDPGTPLTEAISHGDLNTVKCLLKNGADINFLPDPKVQSTVDYQDVFPPIIFAVRYRNLEIARNLIENGANIYLTSFRDPPKTAMSSVEEDRGEIGQKEKMLKLLNSAIYTDQLLGNFPGEVPQDLDIDLVIKRYKFFVLQAGLTSESQTYIDNINTQSIPQQLKTELIKLFQKSLEAFDDVCTSLWYQADNTLSPVPLGLQIDKMEKYNQEITGNTENLIKWYIGKGAQFSFDIAKFLNHQLLSQEEEMLTPDEKEIVTITLKQEIHQANVDILKQNIAKFLVINPNCYEQLQQILETCLLPRDLREILSKIIKCYDDQQKDPISVAKSEINAEYAMKIFDLDEKTSFLEKNYKKLSHMLELVCSQTGVKFDSDQQDVQGVGLHGEGHGVE